MTEGNVSKGVSLVVLRTASQPSLRSELEGIGEAVRVQHEVPGQSGTIEVRDSHKDTVIGGQAQK